MHGGYCISEIKNDVALLRLAIPVTLGSKVGTVCLPDAGSRVLPGIKCWITGLDDYYVWIIYSISTNSDLRCWSKPFQMKSLHEGFLSQTKHSETFSLHSLSLSITIIFNLLHSEPALILLSLFFYFRCFSTVVKYYFIFFFIWRQSHSSPKNVYGYPFKQTRKSFQMPLGNVLTRGVCEIMHFFQLTRLTY